MSTDGALAHDASTGRIGKVVGVAGPFVLLQPLRGGKPWQAHQAVVRPLSASEALTATVREANRVSREGLRP